MVDVSDIFYFFLCSGEGKEESEASERGGGSVFIENPRRGLPGGGGGRGTGRVSGGNLGGGG